MAAPVTMDEVRRTFDCLLTDAVVLAVSGGADSMALLHLVADWRDDALAAGRPEPRILIATVNHGLRPEAAREARFVAGCAAARRLPHDTLRWDAEKPATGLQQAAREARYALLAARARGWGGDVCRIATAHHADDLAETLLLRLARGSGVRGLGGMTEIGPLPLTRDQRAVAGDMDIVRPLLSVEKERLVAMLKSRGLAWIEDPSNDDAHFERVRWRQARSDLAVLGLTNTALSLAARRLARAETAVWSASSDLLATGVRQPHDALAEIKTEPLLAAPAEVAIRSLERVLAAHGGQAELAGLAQVERVYETLSAADGRLRMTLGGTIIERGDWRQAPVLVMREMRAPVPDVTLAPGAAGVWDRRFRVRAGPRVQGCLQVRALGGAGRLHLLAAGIDGRTVGLPAHAMECLPAFWQADDLVAVPSLAWRGEGWVGLPADCDLQVEFLRLER